MILLRYLFVFLCCLMSSSGDILILQIFMYQLVRNQYPSTEKRLLDDVLGMCELLYQTLYDPRFFVLNVHI